MDFFNERMGRTLWNHTPKEIQDIDIECRRNEIAKLKDYILIKGVE